MREPALEFELYRNTGATTSLEERIQVYYFLVLHMRLRKCQIHIKERFQGDYREAKFLLPLGIYRSLAQLCWMVDHNCRVYHFPVICTDSLFLFMWVIEN